MTRARLTRTAGWFAALTLSLAAEGLSLAQTSQPKPPGPAASGSSALPDRIPLFPLPDAVLFPSASRPLTIYEPRYRTMVADALKGDRIIGMVMLKPGFEADYDARPPIYLVGCAGRISEVEQLPDGRYTLVLRGVTRFRVLSEDQSRAYRLGRVEAIPEVARDDDGPVLRTDRKRLETMLATQGFEVSVRGATDQEVIDVVSQYVEIEPERRQQLLELDSARSRARALIETLTVR